MLQGHHFLFPNVPWIYLPHSFLVSDEIRSYGMTGILNWSTLRLYRGLQKWALSSADWTMRFTNLGLRALADEYEWEPGGRGVVNPVGIDLPSFSQKDSNGLFRFLAVGRLVESKNIALAIRAVSGLSISDWRLDIVGGGPETGALQRLALELGCDKKVVFHGHQEDCSEWYRKADLLLFPSRLESLGLVVLEAMGHGTPCLGIRANGSSFQNVNAEIIENGSTGILAKDELDFLNQIKWAVDHRNEIRFMGDRGRSYVQQNHSWERHLSIYEALAQKAC
jgi:glycosyltransferase involved in cell wall biosynthesis